MSCPHGYGERALFRKCKFEARYDLSASNLGAELSKNISAEEMILMMDQYRIKTYVRDVCVTCGKTIERVK